MKREILLYEIKRTLVCVAAAFLYALGVNLFIVPAGLYSGGVMGISQVIRTLLSRFAGLDFGGFDVAGLIYYMINIPLFLLAFTRLGKTFFVKTLVAVTAMTLFLSMVPVQVIVEERMASCVVGSIISGSGMGLMLRMASSSGGLDVVGLIVSRWKQDFSVGKAGLVVNLALYGICFFLFDIETVVYCIIYAAVSSMAMDRVHTQNINVEANIITKADTAEMERVIFAELNRGITIWNTQGAYTHQQSHMLYITLSKYEVSRLKAVVHQYDPHAFIVLNEGVHVDGNFLKKL